MRQQCFRSASFSIKNNVFSCSQYLVHILRRRYLQRVVKRLFESEGGGILPVRGRKIKFYAETIRKTSDRDEWRGLSFP